MKSVVPFPPVINDLNFGLVGPGPQPGQHALICPSKIAGIEKVVEGCRRKLCKVSHYKACELFKTWRRESVMANDVVCSWYIVDAGNRDVGDTSNVTSKITSLHKCLNIFENEER